MNVNNSSLDSKKEEDSDAFLTELHKVLIYEQWTAAAKLIKDSTKEEIDAQDNNGYTALMLASYKGNQEIVEQLLSAQADPNKTNITGRSALLFSSSEGYATIAEVLLEKGAELNSTEENGMTPLHAASQNGHLEVVKLLVNKMAKVNHKSNGQVTPLFLAASGCHLKVIEFLLDSGADINCTSVFGENALTAAISSEQFNLETRIKMIKLLLKHNVQIHNVHVHPNLRTPLMLAVGKGAPQIVEILLKRGVNPNEVDEGGNSALLIAANMGFSESALED